MFVSHACRYFGFCIRKHFSGDENSVTDFMGWEFRSEVGILEYVVTGSQMKQIDEDTIGRIGIPSMVLMERAALAVAEAVGRLCGRRESGGMAQGEPGGSSPADKSPRVLIACGTGNNGADGIAVGRILNARGYRVTILLAGDLGHASKGHMAQREIARNLGLAMVGDGEFVPGRYDVIVDALFGIGLCREIGGAYRELIGLLVKMREESGARVAAVDIPSGIHADTGAVMGIAMPADVTVTFGYRKTGLSLYPGRGYAGCVHVADIGFSRASLQRVGWDGMMLSRADLSRIPERQADGNKGTFGKILVVAGCAGMGGAAYLSALAAYRTGAGLVKILTVPENRVMLQANLPEAIVETYAPESIPASCDAALPGDGGMRDFLGRQCDWADVIVLGPGLGQEAYVEPLVEAVLSHAYVPIVLDADGLNTVAANPYLTKYFTENIIITPHMGEMARLCACTVSELKADPVRAAREYSGRYGVTCVMKDAVTVSADKDGNAYLNPSGCSAMAKAGSGDVLSGTVAGLLARGMECAEAAAFGVYIHGLAGEAAAGRYGENSLLARDIADCLLQGGDGWRKERP